MTISIIAAISKNRIIGIGDKLPWDLPSDMAHFKKLTLGKPVIMGQKTFESIGRPLGGRKNIVLTLNKDFKAKGCIIARSIEQALEKAKPAKEAMIAGGASVYKQFFPLAHCLYLTIIEHNFKGDVFFPEFDYNDWQEIERVEVGQSERNPYKHAFLTLKRKI